MKTLGIAVLLSNAFILLCSGDPAPIPPDVLEKLRSMHRKGDIHNIGLRVIPSPASRQLLTGSITHRKQSKTERTGAHDSGMPGSTGGGSHFNTGENEEVITDPKQASNSCERRDICVPVPIENKDSSIFAFPQCIELPQCLGSCCDSYQKCHARHVVPVKVAVTMWQFMNGGLQEVNETYVQMEKHMDCGCEKCRENSVVCKANQVRKDCACHCANEHEAVNCNSPRKWSNDECKCECTIESCAAGETLSEQECKCFPAFGTRRNARKRRPTNYVQAPRSLQNDVGELPRLAANHMSSRAPRIYH